MTRKHTSQDEEGLLAESSFFRNVEEENDDWTDSESWEDEEIDEEEDPEPSAVRSTRRRRRRSSGGSTSAGVVAAWLLGAIGLVLAVAGAVVPAARPVIDALANASLQPIHLCLAALLLGSVASVKNQLGSRLEDMSANVEELEAQVASQPAAPATIQSSEGGSEDIQRMLVAMQRQDEKINNLTRATKMYGKPLIDISTQITEVTSTISELGGLGQSLDAGLQKLESNLSTAIEAQAQGGADSALTDQLAEVLVAAKRTSSTVADLQMDMTDKLQRRLDEVRRDVEQLVDFATNSETPTLDTSALETIEDGITILRRDVEGLATTVARIDARPAPAVAGSSVSPQSATAPKAEAPAPAGSKPAPAGLAQSIAGERKGGGKNVLGAIQKLKSMRQ